MNWPVEEKKESDSPDSILSGLGDFRKEERKQMIEICMISSRKVGSEQSPRTLRLRRGRNR